MHHGFTYESRESREQSGRIVRVKWTINEQGNGCNMSTHTQKWNERAKSGGSEVKKKKSL